MWITKDVLQRVQSGNLYPGQQTEIMTVLNGAMSIGNRPVFNSAGSTFAANYKAKYGQNYTNYALLAYDIVYLFYNTIERIIAQGDNFFSTSVLMEYLRSADFTAASGPMQFSDGTNDRTATGYSLFNVQNGSLIEINQYDPLHGYTENSPTIV